MLTIAIRILKVVYLAGITLARVPKQSITFGDSKSHLCFLKPENAMPLLMPRSVFINLRAMIRRSVRKQI